MRSPNERNPSTERRETVRRGLRILARMIARAHLRRQASRSLPPLKVPPKREDGH